MFFLALISIEIDRDEAVEQGDVPDEPLRIFQEKHPHGFSCFLHTVFFIFSKFSWSSLSSSSSLSTLMSMSVLLLLLLFRAMVNETRLFRSRHDDPHPHRRLSTQNVPVCTFKTSPCELAPRAHVFQHGRVVPVHTVTF